MDTANIERYLNSFGKQVVNRSKGNLQKAGKGGKLEESISFKVIKEGENYTVQFYMSSYGQFVDKGVSGTQKKRTFKDYKSKVIKSPYSYKNSKGHSQPPSKALDGWAVKKGIAPSFFQKPLGLGLKQFGEELLGNVKEDILNTLNKETITQVK